MRKDFKLISKLRVGKMVWTYGYGWARVVSIEPHIEKSIFDQVVLDFSDNYNGLGGYWDEYSERFVERGRFYITDDPKIEKAGYKNTLLVTRRRSFPKKLKRA